MKAGAKATAGIKGWGFVMRGCGLRLGAVLLASTILSGAVLVAVDTAYAQNAERQYQLNIAPQPVSQALNAIGRATGLSVVVNGSIPGVSSRPVSGNLTARQAISAALAGTGLTYNFTNANTVTVFDPSTGAQTGAYADGETIQLEAIEVSGESKGGWATAAEEPYKTPGSSAFISQEQMQRVPGTSTGDVFKTTPGVIAAGNRNGASVDVNIRGLQGSNRVNVMVDGTQQSTSVYRGYSGHGSRTYVDPELIGGISIDKGPSSGPYGAGAMGGVVNMRTLEAGDVVKEGQTIGARVRAAFASNSLPPPDATPAGGTAVPRNETTDIFENDNFRGSVAFGVVSENVDIVGAFARRKNGNYSAGTKGDLTAEMNGVTQQLSPYKYGDEVFNTSNDVESYLAKGTFRFADDHSLELGYIRYENEFGEVSPLTTQFGWRRQEELADTATDTYTSKYKYDPDGELIDFQANLWRADTESHIPASNLPQNTDSANWGVEAWNDFRFDVMDGGTIRIGVSHSDEHSTSVYETIGYVLEALEGNRVLTSAFSDAKLQINDWVAVSGGLRYDAYALDGPIYDLTRTPIGGGQFETVYKKVGEKSDDGGRWNPSVGVAISPWHDIQFFGKYSEGFRPPSVREAFLGLGNHNGIDILPNPNLKPEIAKNYEFGVNVIRRDLIAADDSFRAKVAYFDNTYEDYIVRMVGGPLGVPATDTWTNIDAAKYEGFEVSFDYDAGFIFASGALSYYTDIKYCAPPATPANAPSRCAAEPVWRDYGSDYVPPEYMASFTLGGRFFEQKLTLGGRATVFGERAIPGSSNATIAPTLWAETAVFDVFGSYEVVEDAEINFSIENIFDRYYVDPIGIGRHPAPGLTARMGFATKF